MMTCSTPRRCFRGLGSVLGIRVPRLVRLLHHRATAGSVRLFAPKVRLCCGAQFIARTLCLLTESEIKEHVHVSAPNQLQDEHVVLYCLQCRLGSSFSVQFRGQD